MSSAEPSEPTTHLTDLVWEDADPGSGVWWLSRAHDDARDFFIAEDPLTGFVVAVVTPRRSGHFRVVAAIRLADVLNFYDAVAAIKSQVHLSLTHPEVATVRELVHRWRRRRTWVLIRDNLPLGTAAYLIGSLLGFFIAVFAISSGLAGAPIVFVGMLIGAMGGSFLKFLADRKPRKESLALAGSWGRFAVITAGAILGAGLTSAGVLTLFWN